MKTKDQLRKKFLILRKKKYFDVSKSKFYQLCDFVKKRFKSKKKIVVALYYPSNYEIDIFKIKNIFNSSKIRYLLPRIQDNNLLKFVEWNDRDILLVNKYGIPEPLNTQKNYSPDIVLVPLLAFDNEKNRLGYGKGFYDRYLNKLIKSNKKILAIGVAFSFQKYKKIPSSKFDFQLNKVFTEKGFI
tara:strand:- start:29 stop:586 length:558 start_codon:yes stop_codon:yes gene_type:complete